MKQIEYYMSLPFDVAGSRTKNRFRMELLWGVSKILELMETRDDFTIVFDYVCDIEIHMNDKFEFYQIKTHKESQPQYTVNSLVKIKKDETGSILGKLFVLKNGEDIPVKVAIVCNTPLKVLLNVPGEKSLNDLSEEKKNVIINALKTELGTDEIDLTNSFYIYTPMNLLQPENEIKGKLIASFENIKGSEPINPNALYRLVLETVSEKASYEFVIEDYEQLMQLKGISRSEFDRMLDVHANNAITGITQTKKCIEHIDNIHEKRKYKSALNTLIPKMARSRIAQKLEVSMAKTLNSHPEVSDIDLSIKFLMDMYEHEFPIEYDDTEKKVFCLIVIHKFVEGGYDNEINI